MANSSVRKDFRQVIANAHIWAKHKKSRKISSKTSTPDAGALTPRVMTQGAERRSSHWQEVLRCVVSGCLSYCPVNYREIRRREGKWIQELILDFEMFQKDGSTCITHTSPQRGYMEEITLITADFF
jgi:hypothetical protein